MPQRVTIGGLSALVDEPARETKPPLLFIHGYFARGISFERMMPWFVARGHRCCAPDLRGRGESMPDVDVGRISIHDYADDIARVVREMDNPVIIGHSMGGLIAQLVAERGLGRAIVLLAPAPPRPIPVMSFKLAIAQIGYMPALLTSRAVPPGRRDLLPLALNRVVPSERELVLDTLVPDSGRAAREMAFLGVPVDRSKIHVPMLVIAGDDDRFIPVSRARRVAKRYHATMRIAPGRGHMLVIEPGFEEVCRWIGAWLDAQSLSGYHP